MIQSDVRRWLRLQLIVLAMNLTGCATRSIPVAICPAPQRVPESLKVPAPPSDFSDRALSDIRTWLEELTSWRTSSGATKP